MKIWFYFQGIYHPKFELKILEEFKKKKKKLIFRHARENKYYSFEFREILI